MSGGRPSRPPSARRGRIGHKKNRGNVPPAAERRPGRLKRRIGFGDAEPVSTVAAAARRDGGPTGEERGRSGSTKKERGLARRGQKRKKSAHIHSFSGKPAARPPLSWGNGTRRCRAVDTWVDTSVDTSVDTMAGHPLQVAHGTKRCPISEPAPGLETLRRGVARPRRCRYTDGVTPPGIGSPNPSSGSSGAVDRGAQGQVDGGFDRARRDQPRRAGPRSRRNRGRPRLRRWPATSMSTAMISPTPEPAASIAVASGTHERCRRVPSVPTAPTTRVAIPVGGSWAVSHHRRLLIGRLGASHGTGGAPMPKTRSAAQAGMLDRVADG